MDLSKSSIVGPINYFNLPKGFRIARLASRKSEFSRFSRGRHGACLLKGNRVVSFGFNQRKTHPIVSKFTKSVDGRKRFVVIHAELDCIFGLDSSSTEGGTMYVWRESSKGTPLISKPCEMCSLLLRQAKLKKVIYTISEEPYYSQTSL
jgi:deoxycytidylate deaminase